jgi:DNA-directed RNA polymerase beta' subunit
MGKSTMESARLRRFKLLADSSIAVGYIQHGTGLVDLKQKCQDLTTMNKKLETDLADLKTKNKKLEDDIRRLRIIMIKYRTEMESIYIESKKRKASN